MSAKSILDMIPKVPIEKSKHQFNKCYLLAGNICNLTKKFLDENLKEGKRMSNSKSNEGKSIFIIFYKAQNMFFDLKELLKNIRIQSSGVILRALLECNGNAQWIAKDSSESKKRAKEFLESIEITDKFVSKISTNTTLKELGKNQWTKVSVENRIKSAGNGWLMAYRHLCSYTHSDAGYLSHIIRQEEWGLRTLWMFFANKIMIELFETLDDIRLLNDSVKEDLNLIRIEFESIEFQKKDNL